MQIGTPDMGYASYRKLPYAGIEPKVSSWYRDLSNIPGGGKYHAIRFLAVARPEGDIIRLDPELTDMTRQCLEHYAATGTKTIGEGDIIWSDKFGASLSGPYEYLRPVVFLYDDEMNLLRQDRPWYKTTYDLENKAVFSRNWNNSGFLPPTVSVMNQTRLGKARYHALSPKEIWKRMEGQPGRLKAGFGASGNANATFNSLSELESLMLSDTWMEIDYVVQQDVGRLDISLNYYADGKQAHFLFGTEQQNIGASHVGNIQDDSHNDYCRLITDKVADYAQTNGFRGFFGFDLRVNPVQKQAWVVECNARITAPVYGWLLARQHQAPWFSVANLKEVKYQTINEVVPSEMQYSTHVGEGIILHNPGPLEIARECSVTVLAQGASAGLDLLEAVRSRACDVRSPVAATA